MKKTKKEVIEMTQDEAREFEQFKKLKLEKEREAYLQTQRETYKDLVDSTVTRVFDAMQELSNIMIEQKAKIFDDFATVLDLKAEIFGVKEGQRSHTFSTGDGKKSIIIGHRIIDHYDDTITVGIEKIKEYLKSLVKDEETGNLMEVINNLLRQDKFGNLKPNRIIELQKLEAKIANKGFSEGLKIIRDAYKPINSCKYISVSYKDKNGKEQSIPLSMSAADVKTDEK
ncbi:MAG: DUF3164 family protein [Bacteroidales bacterium]|jgi:hypothetical protein|nr:DUF3164 family protein [Bacteroidales bacterium]